MGIFNKSGDRNSITKENTTISKTTRLIGEIVSESNLHIDGDMEGKISSTSMVSIGKSGFFRGDVIAKKLIVSGQLHGKINCKIVEIMSGGKVVGEIVTSNLIVHDKGVFDGVCRYEEDVIIEEPKQLEP